MVASELPTTPAPPAPQQITATPVAAVAADTDNNAKAGDSDFNSVLSQLLDTNAAPTSDATAAAKKTLQQELEEVGKDALSAATDASALQPFAAPAVADITLALRNIVAKVPNDADAAIQTASTTTTVSTAAAIVANAQLQAAAAKIDPLLTTDTPDAQDPSLSLTASLPPVVQSQGAQSQVALSLFAQASHAQLSKEQQLQAQLAQALQLKGAGDASGSGGSGLSSDTSDKHNKSGLQDGADIAAILNGVTTQQPEMRTELQIQARVGTPAWRDEVGAKLTWMIDRGVQHGTLHLSPENLGPMEVRISTQNDQVSVWFGAAHADTRAALENALPRLREMLASQGMSLADAGVFREPPKDTPRGYTPQFTDMQSGSTEELAIAVRRRDGILDAYA